MSVMVSEEDYHLDDAGEIDEASEDVQADLEALQCFWAFKVALYCLVWSNHVQCTFKDDLLSRCSSKAAWIGPQRCSPF